MRTIDADALKKCAIPCEIHNGALTDLCVPLYQIDNAPTVEPERPQGEWIPVSERLPEEANQAYLVTIAYGDDVACSCQGFFFGEGIGWNDSCVIAWMPLPEPYKKEGEEE